MLVKKTLETTLNLSDPNDVYTKNFDELCIAKLSDKYVNKCFNSCYVVKILRIIKRSYRYMKETLDGGSLTDIKFEALVLVYQKGDIINNCRIIKKEPNGIVHACSKFAGIQFKQSQNYEIYKEDDIVPVIVKKIRYNVNQTAVTVSAHPFTPIPNIENDYLIFYKIKGNMSNDELNIIKDLLKQLSDITTIIKNASTAHKKIYKFFADLIYPYKKEYDYEKILKSKKISFDQNLQNETDIVYLPITKTLIGSASNVTKNMFYSIKSNDFDELKLSSQLKNTPYADKYQVIEESPYLIFMSMINKHMKNLNTLKEFIETYNTFSDVQKYREIWKLYNILKT